MDKIPEGCSPVNARQQLEATLLAAEATLQYTIALRFTELLQAIVGYMLGRSYHRRRVIVPRQQRREGKCLRCGARASHRFSRNGFRERQVLTRWGPLIIHLPRVRCVCGGSMRIDFDGLLHSYQRLWDDVDIQIQRWGALALSLRQMREGLEDLHSGTLSLPMMFVTPE